MDQNNINTMAKMLANVMGGAVAPVAGTVAGGMEANRAEILARTRNAYPQWNDKTDEELWQMLSSKIIDVPPAPQSAPTGPTQPTAPVDGPIVPLGRRLDEWFKEPGRFVSEDSPGQRGTGNREGEQTGVRHQGQYEWELENKRREAEGLPPLTWEEYNNR